MGCPSQYELRPWWQVHVEGTELTHIQGITYSVMRLVTVATFDINKGVFGRVVVPRLQIWCYATKTSQWNRKIDRDLKETEGLERVESQVEGDW